MVGASTSRVGTPFHDRQRFVAPRNHKIDTPDQRLGLSSALAAMAERGRAEVERIGIVSDQRKALMTGRDTSPPRNCTMQWGEGMVQRCDSMLSCMICPFAICSPEQFFPASVPANNVVPRGIP